MARILVIDDDEPLRQLVRLTLEGCGHVISEAGDGREGLRLFTSHPFDVVLCDIFMPVCEGLETIQQLRAADARIPIIAMSGGSARTQTDFLPIASALGARRTLPKPFDVRELREAVQNCLPNPAEAPAG